MSNIKVDYDILNQKGSPAWYSDTFANIPTPGYKGRMFISTDTFAFYRDNGTGWDLVGGPGTGTITGAGVSGQVTYFIGTDTIGGNNNLFYDITNSRLGIGTATPGAPLDIHSTGTAAQFNGTGVNNSFVLFQNAGSSKWRVGNLYNAGANSFQVYDVLNSTTRLTMLNTGATTLNGAFTSTSVAITGGTSSQYLKADGSTSTLTNPVTGTGTSGQVAYFDSASSITSNAAFAFTPTSQLLVNNSVTAASLIARGTNLTPTLTAAANSDVLVGLDINPTFTNGAFTGVSNIAARFQDAILVTKNTNALFAGINVTNANTNSSASATLNINSDVASLTNSVYSSTRLNNATNQYVNGPSALIDYQGTASLNIASANSAGTNLGIRFWTGISTNLATEKIRIFPSGNLTIQNGGTFTDNSYQLEIVGGQRNIINSNTLYNNLTLTNTNASSGASATLLMSADVSTISQFVFSSTRGNNNSNQYNTGASALYDYQGLASLNFASSSGTSSNNGIRFWTGASTNLATERMRLFASGNLLLQNGGTLTDAGFRLDVNGTARVQGQATIQGMTVGLGGGANANSVAVGLASLVSNSTGSANTSIGASSLNALISGGANTSVGFSALSASNGTGNTSLGASTFRHLTSGDLNVAIGQDAGRYISGGVTQNTISNNSIFIGTQAFPLANNQTNQIVIGYNAVGLGSNTTVINNSSTTNTSINGRVNILNATDNALFSLNSGGTLYTVGFSPTATASSTNTFTITTGTTTWIYTGTGIATWTLPNPSGNNQIYWIKNAGTGIITLNAFAGTNIIDNSATSVSSITIAVGATAVIAQDGNVKSYQLQ